MIRQTDVISGPAFPFRFENGGVAQATGAEKLSQNLRHLLLTRIGERVMRRDLGGGLETAMNEVSDASLGGLVRHELQRAVRSFAPEIEIISDIDVRVEGSEIHVAFSYRAARIGGPARLTLMLEKEV